jgi:hypothetical protein
MVFSYSLSLSLTLNHTHTLSLSYTLLSTSHSFSAMLALYRLKRSTLAPKWSVEMKSIFTSHAQWYQRQISSRIRMNSVSKTYVTQKKMLVGISCRKFHFWKKKSNCVSVGRCNLRNKNACTLFSRYETHFL